MKVLVIGATGNLGIRLVAALLTHGHSVAAFVRSSNKLESLLPTSAYRQITVVEGDAKDSVAIKRAILDADCDAVVNTAGLAALPPWGKSELPAIFRAVLAAVREAGVDRKKAVKSLVLSWLRSVILPRIGNDALELRPHLPRTPPKPAPPQIPPTKHSRLVHAMSQHHDHRVLSHQRTNKYFAGETNR